MTETADSEIVSTRQQRIAQLAKQLRGKGLTSWIMPTCGRFSNNGDARRVMAVLPKRFGKYGLMIHPDKTRLVQPAPGTLPCALPACDPLGVPRRSEWVT